MSVISISPSEVRFVQDTISTTFRQPSRRLTSTFQSLVDPTTGLLDSMERITVMLKDDHYWAINGNRRLYLYKILEELRGRPMLIEVNVHQFSETQFKRNYSTENEGQRIRVRGGDQIENRFVRELFDIYHNHTHRREKTSVTFDSFLKKSFVSWKPNRSSPGSDTDVKVETTNEGNSHISTQGIMAETYSEENCKLSTETESSQPIKEEGFSMTLTETEDTRCIDTKHNILSAESTHVVITNVNTLSMQGEYPQSDSQGKGFPISPTKIKRIDEHPMLLTDNPQSDREEATIQISPESENSNNNQYISENLSLEPTRKEKSQLTQETITNDQTENRTQVDLHVSEETDNQRENVYELLATPSPEPEHESDNLSTTTQCQGKCLDPIQDNDDVTKEEDVESANEKDNTWVTECQSSDGTDSTLNRGSCDTDNTRTRVPCEDGGLVYPFIAEEHSNEEGSKGGTSWVEIESVSPSTAISECVDVLSSAAALESTEGLLFAKTPAECGIGRKRSNNESNIQCHQEDNDVDKTREELDCEPPENKKTRQCNDCE